MEISSSTNAPMMELSLTTPFIGKRIEINAYTQLDKVKPVEEGVVYSRADFYNIERLAPRVTVSQNGVSQHPSKAIVQNYIQSGMSPLEAVNAYKAQLTYGVASNVNGVGLLNSQNTEI